MLIYAGVVSIQPLALGFRKQIDNDSRCVYVTEGYGLETKPVAKFIALILNAEDKALVAHTVHTLAIDARLIRSDHSRGNRYALEVLAYVLRPFVNSEEEADAVTGAVTVIAAHMPERNPGERVKLAACGSPRENSHCQTYMALEHKGIILLLEHSARSERHGAGDIRGAVHILPAAVAKIQAARFKHWRSYPRSDVVRQCSRCAIGRNGLKAVPAIARNLSPEAAQLDSSIPFAYGNAVGKAAFEPV